MTKEDKIKAKNYFRNNVSFLQKKPGPKIPEEDLEKYLEVVNKRRPYCSFDFIPQHFIDVPNNQR
jgi:hypothetical protein